MIKTGDIIASTDGLQNKKQSFGGDCNERFQS